MTVAELIEALRGLPQDARVVVFDEDAQDWRPLHGASYAAQLSGRHWTDEPHIHVALVD